MSIVLGDVQIGVYSGLNVERAIVGDIRDWVV